MATFQEAEEEVAKHLQKDGLRPVPAPGAPVEELVVLALKDNEFVGSVVLPRSYVERFPASTIADHLDQKTVAERIQRSRPGRSSYPNYVRLDANEDGSPAVGPS